MVFEILLSAESANSAYDFTVFEAQEEQRLGIAFRCKL
jgi:hypothetical protein